jgi:integrase
VKRGGIEYLYVPRQSGGVVLRTTGTKDKSVVRGMKRMLEDLKHGRRWALLGAVTGGRLTLGDLYDAHVANALNALETSMNAAPLAGHVTGHLSDCRAKGLAPRNIENLARQLKSFLAFVPSPSAGLRGPAMLTTDLNPARIKAWMASLDVSSGTRRQYLYAVTGFAQYLVDVEVLADFPLARVKAPKKNSPRMRYETESVDLAIVNAASPKYRALFAFIKATGVDVSVALTTLRRDIDFVDGLAELKGTKTARRQVHNAIIEAWALPILAEHAKDLTPNAPLWPDLTRFGVQNHHKRCCEAVQVQEYTLRDSRHSIAVRMLQAGYNVMEIAEQLGNSPDLVARVYARFVPKMERRDPLPAARLTRVS